MILCTVPEEQKSRKQTQALPLSGAELAAMMKIGTRVMRGVDWKWGDQVCRVFPCILMFEETGKHYRNCHFFPVLVETEHESAQ